MAARDWAGLHLDILVSIRKKIRLIEDFITFGWVCRSWWEAARNSKYCLRPQIPWMTLPDDKNHQLLCELRREESMLTKNLHIPEKFEEMCFGLNYGWILLVSREWEMNLFNPLSGDRIKLPDIRSCIESYARISRAALSSNPSQTPDFAVTIVVSWSRRLLMFSSYNTTPGDKRRTRILGNLPPGTMWKDYQYPGTNCLDVTYYQDRLYAIDDDGKIWDCSVSDPQDCVLVMALSLAIIMRCHSWRYSAFIVGSEGGLLAVVKSCSTDFGINSLTGPVEVYKLDLINGRHEQIKDLGDKAIFIGHNMTIIVGDVSRFGSGLMKPNHIYLSRFKGTYYSYSLGEGWCPILEVPMPLDGLSRTAVERPFWYMPSV